MNISYSPPGPVAQAFFGSDAFIRGLKGPFGSGKSVACCMEIVRRAFRQAPDASGMRRTRWAVARNCYDDQTEILTENRGFQLFKDLHPEDRVATLQEDRIVYVRPDGVSISDYDGEMIGFEGEGVDFLVTPDHEMWVSKARTRKKTWGEYEMRYAEEIHGSTSYRVRRDAGWIGSDIGFTEAECELVGYWYAEGSRTALDSRRDRLAVTTVNDVDYARKLFREAGVEYFETKRAGGGINIVFHAASRIEALLRGNSSTKAVPQLIKEAPRAHIQAFLRGYAAGDGHQRKDSVTQTLYTSSKKLADGMQELALKAGLAANVSSRDRRGTKIQVNGANGVINHVEYTVTLLGAKKLRPRLIKQVGRYRGWYKQQYSGKVYCAEMDEPVVFVRRNGRAFWCRRTYPELKSTTIRTWVDWIKPELFGPVKWDTPITHKVKLAHDVELEVLFLAMDRPDDVKKLLSLEVTGVWLNEAREFPKAILDGATGRVGRFPARKDGGCTWSGVIMDTNPPDTDHWWYKLAEEPDLEQLAELEAELVAMGALQFGQPLISFFDQPSGTSPHAENVENLPPGYYVRQMAGKSPDWIDVHVHGKYGSVQDGKPVFPEFNPVLHIAPKPLRADSSQPLVLGWDFGLTPACAVTQLTRNGRLMCLGEVTSDNVVLSQFVKRQVKPYLNARFPGMKVVSMIDPAGKERGQAKGDTCWDVLRSEGMSPSTPWTNLFDPRREALVAYLTALVGGQPAFLVSPECRTIIKGLKGGYRFRRVQVPGEERFQDKPDKNSVSHVTEALCYAAMKSGRPFRPERSKLPPNKIHRPASSAGY